MCCTHVACCLFDDNIFLIKIFIIKYFSCLSSEEKGEEVMRLLPAITSFERNFNEVRDEIEASLNRLERTNLIKRLEGFFSN